MAGDLITVQEARDLVLARVERLSSETTPLEAALDRVLAEDVRAVSDVPPFACSAMDGYAVTAGESGRVLEVVGESRAGAPTDLRLENGQAIRISTGAAVPTGATAVIPQEDVSLENGQVRLGVPIGKGENVRGPGEDMAAATLVLRAGARLGPIELGAATAAGVGSLRTARPPEVAVLCTGDELRAPGEALGPGEIHNSNAPMLAGLAGHAGARVSPPGRLPDDAQATRTGIASVLGQADFVIISGGVSVGPHDHVKPVLAELGVEEVFWGVALQPGKPTWFGRHEDGRLVFGLPGNPVSAVVTFSLFVAPALAAAQGRRVDSQPEPRATLGVEVKRNPGREQALRVSLERGDHLPVAAPTKAQGSHILTSLLGADALAMIPAGSGSFPPGTEVALRELAG
jgi:molybdopterin molybdotransferase